MYLVRYFGLVLKMKRSEMYVSRVHAIWVLCLISGGLALQMEELNGEETLNASVPESTTTGNITTTAQSATAQIITSTLNPPTEEQRRNCSTPRQLDGTCVQRQLCEYSTIAIDLTLYMPKGYIKPCVIGEVCCPFKYLTVIKPSSVDLQNDDFSFDDDD